MRVLHIANTWFFVERLLSGKLEGLRDAGWDVHAAAPVPEEKRGALLPCWFHPLPMARDIAPFSDGRTLLCCMKLLSEGNYDLVHTHSAKAGFLGRLAAWLCGVPCVHTVHGLPFYEGQPALSRTLCRALEWLAAHWCEGILSQNSADLSALRALNVLPPQRIFYEGNGLNLPQTARVAACRSDMRAELGLSETDVAIGLLARLEPVKDHRTFLRGFEELCRRDKRAVAVVAGGNFGRSSEYARETLRQYESSPFKGRIRLLGYRKDPCRVLSACDILALTSEKEGLPRVVMEAMTLGLPVAATDAPGTRELVRNGVNGLLVPVGNPHALCEALERLSASPALRARLGAAGERFAWRELSEKRVLSRILSAYESIVPSS